MKRKHVFFSVLISAIYVGASGLFLNTTLLQQILGSNYSITAKLLIVGGLLQGVFSAFSPVDIVLTASIGFVIGMNIQLLVQSVKTAKATGMHFSFGGSAVFALTSSGCSACGFSLISIIGTGIGITIAPFITTLFKVAVLCFLLWSWYRLQSKKAQYPVCAVAQK